MNKDKLKIYLLEISLFLFLLFTLFESNAISRVGLSIVLFIYMLICCFFLRKRKVLPIYHKQIIVVMGIFAFVYLAVFYLMGIYFGYYNAPIKLGLWSFLNYILPLTIIIISSEVIRYILLSQKIRRSKILIFIIMVIIDLIIYTGVYDISNIDDFLTIIGFILFASFSCNLLFNYICEKFGYKSIVLYRLITVLYAYILPVIPDIYIFFRSVLRMIYPYLIYLVIDYTYVQKDLTVDFTNRKKNFLSTTLLLGFSLVISLLVSCQFRFGIIVIGSGSMTGTFNKGDAVVFEKYDSQTINEGTVIIFVRDDIRIIHRIVDIKEINGEIRFYTKGDANSQLDEGYVTYKDIYGITKFGIKYLGYPSIWVKDIFS